MSEQFVPRGDVAVAEGTESAAVDLAGGAPSGKPYDWQLRIPEDPELVALAPQALAERAFVKGAMFQDALERTAAYLVVVSRNNRYEGRDPLVICDDVRCGAVSGLLGIDLDVLGRVLLEMRRGGMVSTTDDGSLRIVDLDALDRLSEGRSAGR